MDWHKQILFGEVNFNSGGTLAGINELPLEEYLYGVVPRELPPVPYGAEHPISTEAVQGTTGVIATYDGKLITTVYNSTSGGFSANNEDVWNSEPVPYLRGVPDAERGKSFQHVPTLEVFKNHSNPTSFRAEKEGDFESDWSRYHRWTFEWTSDEMSTVLSDYYNTDVGDVLEINVLDRSDSGRVLNIEFVTENGSFYEKKKPNTLGSKIF